jgi:hypothetical protein
MVGAKRREEGKGTAGKEIRPTAHASNVSQVGQDGGSPGVVLHFIQAAQPSFKHSARA